ncbi:MAG: DUF3108 domain-containing protein [Gammaproteobacteria bacterium]|nr:DUF3108 domain-containing protein [Gammaproteobacteria bacterium]
MRKLQSTFFTLLTIVLLTASQVACTSTRLPPYEATYTTKLRGIKIKGVRKFEATGENSYRISWTAKALWMKLNEWSEFEIINEQVRPLSYHYTRKGLGTDRPIHVYFDWTNMQVNGSKGSKKYTYALQPGALDKLSYQVQMQLDLIREPQTRVFDYIVANYGNMKNYRFDYTNNETINTRLGSRDTMVFERNKKDRVIRLWIAPEQNYLPVKIEQLEDGDSNVVEIRSWESKSLQKRNQVARLAGNNANGNATEAAGPWPEDGSDDDF